MDPLIQQDQRNGDRGQKQMMHTDDEIQENCRGFQCFRITPQEFAELLGSSPATLRNWVQGRRKPEGAARALLCVAAKYPKAVLDTVHA
jgi:DNA-binding transcriptional regulator YiaG